MQSGARGGPLPLAGQMKDIKNSQPGKSTWNIQSYLSNFDTQLEYLKSCIVKEIFPFFVSK